MTIHNHALNERLSNLEACAENAPDGTYESAKEIASLVGDLSNAVLRGLRETGHGARNDDALRDLEASIYGYIIASNPNADFLVAAEAFGEQSQGPVGERVIAQATRDRDALTQ